MMLQNVTLILFQRVETHSGFKVDLEREWSPKACVVSNHSWSGHLIPCQPQMKKYKHSSVCSSSFSERVWMLLLHSRKALPKQGQLLHTLPLMDSTVVAPRCSISCARRHALALPQRETGSAGETVPTFQPEFTVCSGSQLLSALHQGLASQG